MIRVRVSQVQFKLIMIDAVQLIDCCHVCVVVAVPQSRPHGSTPSQP